jgi:ribosome-associated protein
MAKTKTGTSKAAKARAATKASGTARAGATSRASGAARAARVARPARATAKTAPEAKVPKLPKSVAGVIAAAHDKKAVDVVLLDLRKTDGFTDFFVICTGLNPRQINAIADGVRDTLRTEFGERPALAEGTDRSEWILLDYFNFVVHVFSRDCRAFYDLERLWGNAQRYEFEDVQASI